MDTIAKTSSSIIIFNNGLGHSFRVQWPGSNGTSLPEFFTNVLPIVRHVWADELSSGAAYTIYVLSFDVESSSTKEWRFHLFPYLFSPPCVFMEFVLMFPSSLPWFLFANSCLSSAYLASSERSLSSSGFGASHNSFVYNVLYWFSAFKINPSALSCSLPSSHASLISPIYFTNFFP